jgi:hypothetical protein
MRTQMCVQMREGILEREAKKPKKASRKQTGGSEEEEKEGKSKRDVSPEI